MAEKFDSFLKEVDDDLRRDQLKKLWEQYGILIVGGVIALLAAVWGYGHWQNRRVAAAEAHGAKYEAAAKLAREGKTDDASKAFAEIAKTAAPGYQALSQLRVAGLHARAGRIAEAVAAYDLVGNDASVDQILREFAAIQAANLRLEPADYAEMERRLTPLTVDGGAWRTAARELLGLAAYKAGKFEDSRKFFDTLLGDRTVPPGLNERAQLMLAVLTDAEAAKAATAPASTPAATEKSKDKSPPSGTKK
jgi:hypothetical protein